MAGWHALLLDRFAGTDDEAMLDRIAANPGLGGPELTFFRAQLAHQRGDDDGARSLVVDSHHLGHSLSISRTMETTPTLRASKRHVWCPRGDLNPHAPKGTSTSS